MSDDVVSRRLPCKGKQIEAQRKQKSCSTDKELIKGAKILLADYTTDVELLAFTALDGNDFYIQGQK
jgi:hypothetical protein